MKESSAELTKQGTFYLKKGRTKEALEILERAVKIDPKNLVTLVGSGRLRSKKK